MLVVVYTPDKLKFEQMPPPHFCLKVACIKGGPKARMTEGKAHNHGKFCFMQLQTIKDKVLTDGTNIMRS